MNHVYKVKDVWMAIKKASKAFFISLLVLVFLSSIPMAYYDMSNGDSSKLLLWIFGGVFVMAIIQYLRNSFYRIDMETGNVTFPRTDMENSFLDIILLVPFWNLLRSKTIHASEIEGLYLDSNRFGQEMADGIFNISIVGTFGSAKLEFVDRQKRDEVRNAIIQTVKKHKDKDLMFQVAEF